MDDGYDNGYQEDSKVLEIVRNSITGIYEVFGLELNNNEEIKLRKMLKIIDE
jgi:hypothetical protein